MPTPEQIQAAMPAMREHLASTYSPMWRAAREDDVLDGIERTHFGGVAQFIADQEERRG